jgi:polyisoprenoid-binding protein YceI
MQEAEVSLRIAIYHIVNGLTDKDVNVSIDGAHIKTGNTVHFDIDEFMAENACRKIDGNMKRWQGEYRINGYNYFFSTRDGRCKY